MSQQSYSKHQTLDSLNLERYEVFPTEPLHDLKGHIHIIEEATKITNNIWENPANSEKSKKHNPQQMYFVVFRLTDGCNLNLPITEAIQPPRNPNYRPLSYCS